MKILRKRWLGGLCFVGLLTSCQQPASVQQTQAQLSGDAFAVVGLQLLSLNLLNAASADARVNQAEAIVHDSLLAQQARHEKLHSVAAIERGVFSRALVETLEAEALQGKPPSQAELDAHRKRNWLFLDRPRAVRAYEAKISIESILLENEAYALAEQVRSIALETNYIGDFADRMEELAKEHSNLSHSELPPIAADSRVVPLLPQDTRYTGAPEFYGPALAKLEAPGDVSEIVGTANAYYVLIAGEVSPALRPSDERVMLELSKGVAGLRAAPELKRIQQQGKKSVAYSPRDLAPILRLVWRRQ